MINKHLKTLSQKEVESVIIKVANNHANKHFGSYQSDDIIQQASMICWQKLPEFQIKRAKDKNNEAQSLENWLNKVVSNRLKNFYRDHYQNKRKLFKSDKSEYDLKKRESLLEPTNIHGVACFQSKDDLPDNLPLELLNSILPHLTNEDIDIIECLLNGEKVNSYYKKYLQKKVRDIIDE